MWKQTGWFLQDIFRKTDASGQLYDRKYGTDGRYLAAVSRAEPGKNTIIVSGEPDAFLSSGLSGGM